MCVCLCLCVCVCACVFPHIFVWGSCFWFCIPPPPPPPPAASRRLSSHSLSTHTQLVHTTCSHTTSHHTTSHHTTCPHTTCPHTTCPLSLCVAGWHWAGSGGALGRNFSSLIWTAGSAPAALASLLFDPPEPQIIGKTQCFATFLPFLASASSVFLLFLFYSSFF